MRYQDENIWLTQKMLAVLYDVEIPTINYHLKKILKDNELSENSVIRNFLITASDGNSYDTKHYALQAIIAVGFKVNSARVVQFRKWVNQIAKDYTIQGWVMDVDRLKGSGTVLTRISLTSSTCPIPTVKKTWKTPYCTSLSVLFWKWAVILHL
jgi:hypothetical protein